MYLTDVYADSEKKRKLKLIQGDDEVYDRLIENGEPIANNNITANYNYLFKEISRRNAQEIKGLYDAVMKLIIVNISLKPQDGDDPLFVSLGVEKISCSAPARSPWFQVVFDMYI